MRNYCTGCNDDFYNGNNQYGIKECWHKKSAKVVWRKEVPIDLRPPYNHIHKRRFYSCYRRRGFAYLEEK